MATTKPKNDAGSTQLPADLEAWLSKHQAIVARDSMPLPPLQGTGGSRLPRDALFITVSLENLRFQNHDFNARNPNDGKVRSLSAHIRTHGLLNPLACVYLGDKDRGTYPSEPVVLLDGRHRFAALNLLRDGSWEKTARVPILIYNGLPRSDVHVLAVYLNDTRKKLNPGEYYQGVARIYETRKEELAAKLKREPTEQEMFTELAKGAVKDPKVDLSAGRFVGMRAFDAENPAWWPFVSEGQNQTMNDEQIAYLNSADKENEFRCPDQFKGKEGKTPRASVTAGNLAYFIQPMVKPDAYVPGNEARRYVELENFMLLGRQFASHVFKPLWGTRTPAAMACRHWIIRAMGNILQKQTAFHPPGDVDLSVPLLSKDKIPWENVGNMLDDVLKIMEAQLGLAEAVEKAGDNVTAELLQKAWATSFTTVPSVEKMLLHELRALDAGRKTKLYT